MVLATVYNNLNALLKQGYIGVICVEGQPDRYDRVKKHDHLVCRKCGNILDVNLKDYTRSIEKCLGFEINSYDLRINYVCDDCKKLNRRIRWATPSFLYDFTYHVVIYIICKLHLIELTFFEFFI